MIDGVGIIPDGAKRIANKAFYMNKELVSVVIPDTVTEIGAEAFSFCTNLEKVVLPASFR